MKNFFLGEVVHPISFYVKGEINSPEFLKYSNQDFALISYRYYRQILFFLNAQRKMIDFYFDTPSYPILGFSNLDEVKESNIFIHHVQPINEHEMHSFFLHEQPFFLPHHEEGNILKRKKEITICDSTPHCF